MFLTNFRAPFIALFLFGFRAVYCFNIIISASMKVKKECIFDRKMNPVICMKKKTFIKTKPSNLPALNSFIRSSINSSLLSMLFGIGPPCRVEVPLWISWDSHARRQKAKTVANAERDIVYVGRRTKKNVDVIWKYRNRSKLWNKNQFYLRITCQNRFFSTKMHKKKQDNMIPDSRMKKKRKNFRGQPWEANFTVVNIEV